MKRVASLSFFILFILVGASAAFQPVLAVTPTPSPRPTRVPKPTPTPRPTPTEEKRIDRARRIALSQLNKRENGYDTDEKNNAGKFKSVHHRGLKELQAKLESNKSKFLSDDADWLTKMLKDIQDEFSRWRVGINAKTSVDDIKSFHKAEILKTDFEQVMVPKFNKLYALGIAHKSLAQIKKRISNSQTILEGKKNSEKNKAFENATAKLADVKSSVDGLDALVTQTYNDINTLTPDLYNTSVGNYAVAQAKAYSSLSTLKAKIHNAFTKLDELDAILKRMQNLPASNP